MPSYRTAIAHAEADQHAITTRAEHDAWSDDDLPEDREGLDDEELADRRACEERERCRPMYREA